MNLQRCNCSLFLVLSILLISFSGCKSILEKEFARVQAREEGATFDPGKHEADVALQVGEEVGIWSDMDMYYEDDPEIEIQVKIWENESLWKKITFDPRDKGMVFRERKMTYRNKVEWSFRAKNGAVVVEKDGKYRFQASLRSRGGKDLWFEVADVVFKK